MLWMSHLQLSPHLMVWANKKGASTSTDKDVGCWKGQGDWEDDWVETYSGKRQPAFYVFNIKSGDVRAVEGINKSLSAGQVVWSPASSEGVQKYLVFVGWTAECGPKKVSRKLGIKYCYNRPCALYAIRHAFQEPDTTEDLAAAVNLTHGISSAYLPRFSPDGKILLFSSSKCAVDSRAHCATDTLHKIDWVADVKPCPSTEIVEWYLL